MKLPYKSRNPKAGVVSYEVTEAGIVLEFARSKFRYVYSEEVTGVEHVEAMKRLAVRGEGLTTYVSQHVHDRYAGKLPL